MKRWRNTADKSSKSLRCHQGNIQYHNGPDKWMQHWNSSWICALWFWEWHKWLHATIACEVWRMRWMIVFPYLGRGEDWNVWLLLMCIYSIYSNTFSIYSSILLGRELSFHLGDNRVTWSPELFEVESSIMAIFTWIYTRWHIYPEYNSMFQSHFRG